MGEKFTGYLLLVVGLIIIAFAIYSFFRVFNNIGQPPQLFQSEGIAIDLTDIAAGDLPEKQRLQLKEAGTLKTQLVTAALLNRILNLSGFFVFMTFLTFAGYRVSSLGIQMVRPIKVKLNKEVGGEK